MSTTADPVAGDRFDDSSGRLVVVGASAGGVAALIELVRGLPREFTAPMLITLHIGAHKSLLPQLLSHHGERDVAHAESGERIRRGTIRIAPPDHHMIVADGMLQVLRGPKENGARPAIDPMFRSAAIAHGPAVVGVVLTGRLDDGTSGLQEVKRHGGTAIVQDPADAEEPSMPRSAITHVEVDHVVTLAQMPYLLASFCGQPWPDAPRSRGSDAGMAELNVSLCRGDPMQQLQKIGRPSTFACPECHGALWQIFDSHPQRFRCHTGHGYTARSLQAAMAEASDQAGWAALRALQERVILLRHMVTLERDLGREFDANRLEASARQIDRQVDVMLRLLQDGPEPIE